ncbi:MAG: hypothetical protein KA173_05240 [Rhodoferax sp.]|nr:hypothetical protein [Rhodoferax sp.]MBP7490854.1 hypothetical protein [Rhodoferax sp.]
MLHSTQGLLKLTLLATEKTVTRLKQAPAYDPALPLSRDMESAECWHPTTPDA